MFLAIGTETLWTEACSLNQPLLMPICPPLMLEPSRRTSDRWVEPSRPKSVIAAVWSKGGSSTP